MKYLIAYDLRSPHRDYKALIEAIIACGPCIRLSQSCWAISSLLTATQIRYYLAQYTDKDDILFVCRFDFWASLNLPKNDANWLIN